MVWRKISWGLLGVRPQQDQAPCDRGAGGRLCDGPGVRSGFESYGSAEFSSLRTSA